MSKRHGAREQKKLAKQKAKRAAKRRTLARATSADPTVRLAAADRWPVIAAHVPEDLWTKGMGQVVIARRTPQDLVAIGVFLVDVWCLGVKNALWRIDSPDIYRDLLEQFGERAPLKKVTPEYLSKLVHQAADYAQSLGIAPHGDFRHTRMLLEGIDPSQCPEEFQFGKDGKPFYVAGPFDPPHRVRQICELVTAAGGDFVVPVNSDDVDVDDSIIDADEVEYLEDDDE